MGKVSDQIKWAVTRVNVLLIIMSLNEIEQAYEEGETALLALIAQMVGHGMIAIICECSREKEQQK